MSKDLKLAMIGIVHFLISSTIDVLYIAGMIELLRKSTFKKKINIFKKSTFKKKSTSKKQKSRDNAISITRI